MTAKTTVCDVCELTLPIDSLASHLSGKRHKHNEEVNAQRKHLQETGLYVKGVPPGTLASDLSSSFGRFGCVKKIEIYGGVAYVNYSDKSSADEALKHQHVIHHQTLKVNRRIIANRNVEQKKGNFPKRNFDEAMEPKASTSNALPPTKRLKSDNTKLKLELSSKQISEALSDDKTISDQMISLKKLVLPVENYCNKVQMAVCQDLQDALRVSFKICKLYTFGSMTTGLAFKDSDLDVYAYLELDKSTHLIEEGSKSHDKKIYDMASKCLFLKNHIFTSIILIRGAKIPIIKFQHTGSQVSCDLSFRDAVGHCNSALLRLYLEMNERFFDLIFFLKFWARTHNFCSTSKFSNFSLCMLGLSFLLLLKDSRGNKIVPAVDELLESGDPSDPLFYVGSWRCGFNRSRISITLPDTPEFSLIEMLRRFFLYIAHLPFQTHVISVLTGELMPREMFETVSASKNLPTCFECYKIFVAKNPSEVLCKTNDCAVIHDPFRLNHNLTQRVNVSALQEFVEACMFSAGVCEQEMKSNEGRSALLQLLNRKHGGVTQSCIPSPRPKSEDMILALKGKVISEGTNSLKNLEEVISSIFEKLFLLERLHRADSEVKMDVNKRDENQCDQESSNSKPVVYTGGRDLWNGRAKAFKILKKQRVIVNNTHSFENEELVTGFLREQGTANVDLRFEFELTSGQDMIKLKFHDLCRSGAFKSFTSFCGTHLLRWVQDFRVVSLK